MIMQERTSPLLHIDVFIYVSGSPFGPSTANSITSLDFLLGQDGEITMEFRARGDG